MHLKQNCSCDEMHHIKTFYTNPRGEEMIYVSDFRKAIEEDRKSVEQALLLPNQREIALAIATRDAHHKALRAKELGILRKHITDEKEIYDKVLLKATGMSCKAMYEEKIETCEDILAFVDELNLAEVHERQVADIPEGRGLLGVDNRLVAKELAFKVDDALVRGTGAGQPLGILNAGCLVSVAKEAGQGAATVLAENIMKMRSRLFASSRQNSVWLINQNVEPQLHSMSLAVGTGGVPVYMPAGGLSNLPFDTLYGRPVLPIEQCATLGTAGDIILADFSNGYILAEKGGIQADMSIHVQFLYDESVFRFVMRVDGQPVRATALTPYKGGASDTQSHFVALATRA